jgi:hypothetical protein
MTGFAARVLATLEELAAHGVAAPCTLFAPLGHRTPTAVAWRFMDRESARRATTRMTALVARVKAAEEGFPADFAAGVRCPWVGVGVANLGAKARILAWDILLEALHAALRAEPLVGRSGRLDDISRTLRHRWQLHALALAHPGLDAGEMELGPAAAALPDWIRDSDGVDANEANVAFFPRFLQHGLELFITCLLGHRDVLWLELLHRLYVLCIGVVPCCALRLVVTKRLPRIMRD